MSLPDADPTRRLLISAFGINTGGGLVLLEALLPAVRANLRAIALDSRLAARDVPVDEVVSKRLVPRSFLQRWRGLSWLVSQAGPKDVLLCFNSLPPLARPACRVINYVHAPHFAGLHRGIRYSAITRVRIAIERLWFRLGQRHCDEIWVQTASMAAAIGATYPQARISVVPFVDDALIALLPPEPVSTAKQPLAPFTYFYPADDVGHKNHATLLAAWQLLAREGFSPRLELTLTIEELRRFAAHAGIADLKSCNVVALGRLSRSQVLEHLRASSALLFPSLAETLGIPLLEAGALGVPVLAAERDFVRDVASPSESFDPVSPRSIADAVRRHMGAPRRAARPLSAADMAARLSS